MAPCTTLAKRVVQQWPPVPTAESLPSHSNLDASYNKFKTGMRSLLPLTQLRYLHLASNRLTKIEGLDGMGKLLKLDLGNNRIRVSDGSRPGACSGSGLR